MNASDSQVEWSHSTLISRKLLEECAPWGTMPLWQQLLDELRECSIQYPDGSREVCHDRLSAQQQTHLENLRVLIMKACAAKRTAEGRLAGPEGFQTHFRGLWGEARRLYTLWYPDSAQIGLDDRNLLIVPDAWAQVVATENERNALGIVIVMLRKPNDPCRHHVATVLSRWFSMASQGGVNQEGPVRTCQEFIEWRGRAAFVEADFSKSGQSTLNWLTLWILNHVQDYAIELISHGRPETPLVLEATGRSAAVQERLPAEAVVSVSEPLSSGRSQCEILVFKEPGFNSERASLEITFSSVPDHHQRKAIEEALGAWLLVGAHGTFGGRFAYYAPFEWEYAGERLRWWMDFGDADIDVSLAALHRIMKNLSKECVCIESLSLK